MRASHEQDKQFRIPIRFQSHHGEPPVLTLSLKSALCRFASLSCASLRSGPVPRESSRQLFQASTPFARIARCSGFAMEIYHRRFVLRPVKCIYAFLRKLASIRDVAKTIVLVAIDRVHKAKASQLLAPYK